MSKPLNAEVSRLVSQAIRLPEAERIAWLKQACQGNSQLLAAASKELLQASAETIDSNRLSKPTQGEQLRGGPASEEQTVETGPTGNGATGNASAQEYDSSRDETLTLEAETGQQLAHFELLEEIGSGGFGTVYRARDTKLDRTVAVKVPRQGRISDSETEKFFREARTAAQLRHANIVSVHDVGRDGHSIFIVADFIDGVTLAEYLRIRNLMPRQAAELCIKIGRALHYAHEQGVIHRDLKPGNIMMDRDGEPHLMDFGLAKREVGEETMTQEGQIMGTPAYMSPEQARGEAKTVDRRTDIYSLGVVLFELLTGERPFRGETRMLIFQLLTEDAVSPRKLNAATPKDLETICLRCLEKEPAKRFASGEEFAEELERYLAGHPIQSRQITRWYRAWRWCRRNPLVASLSAVLLATLLIGFMVSSSLAVVAKQESVRADERANYADSQKQLADENAAEAETRADEAEQMALYIQAESALIERRYRDAYQFNRQAMQRDSRWEYQHQLYRIVEACQSERRLLAAIPTTSEPNVISFLNEDQILYQTDGTTHRYSISQRKALTTSRDLPTLRRAYAISDEQVVGISDDHIMLFRANDLQPSRQLPLGGTYRDADLSLNRERVVVIKSDGQTLLFTTENLREVARCQLDPTDYMSVSLSPSGQRLVCVMNSMHYIWDSVSGVVRKQELGGFHHTFFGPQENQLISFKHLRSPSTELGVHYMRWADGKLEAFGQTGLARNLLVFGGSPRISLDFPMRGSEKFEVNAGFMSGSTYNVFQTDDLRRGNYFELNHLWPQGTTPVSYVGHSVPHGLMALQADGQLLLLRLNQGLAYGDDRSFGMADAGTEFWTFDASLTHAYSYTSTDGLQRLNARGKIDQRYILTRPNAAPGLMVNPWGISVTPDGRQVAMLWQENNNNGTISSKFFRKLIAIYDLPENYAGDSLPYSHLIDAADFQGLGGRMTRWLKLTADGSHVVFGIGGIPAAKQSKAEVLSPADNFVVKRTVVYNVDTGQPAHELPAQEHAVFTTDGSRYATYSLSAAGPVQIFAVTNGELLHEFPTQQTLHRGAFASAGNEFYIGTHDHKLQCWQIGQDKPMWTIETAAAPLRINAETGTYLGFVPDNRFSGRLVNAKLDSGRIVDVLNRNHWFASEVYWLDGGEAVGFLLDRSRIRVALTYDEPAAISSLGEILTPLPNWQYAHLDPAEVWRNSQELMSQAASKLEAGDIEMAIRLATEAARLPNNGNAWAQVRDLLARQRKWQAAYEASLKLPSHESTYEHGALLFMTGRQEEYIAYRKRMLATDLETLANWQVHAMLRMALLAPVEAELASQLKTLGKRSLKLAEPWERAMVGRVAYRLGQYRRWAATVQEEHTLPQTPLLAHIEAYREEPSDEHREVLKAVVLRSAAGFAEDEKRLLGQYWSDYVERYAYWREAAALVEASPQ